MLNQKFTFSHTNDKEDDSATISNRDIPNSLLRQGNLKREMNDNKSKISPFAQRPVLPAQQAPVQASQPITQPISQPIAAVQPTAQPAVQPQPVQTAFVQPQMIQPQSIQAQNIQSQPAQAQISSFQSQQQATAQLESRPLATAQQAFPRRERQSGNFFQSLKHNLGTLGVSLAAVVLVGAGMTAGIYYFSTMSEPAGQVAGAQSEMDLNGMMSFIASQVDVPATTSDIWQVDDVEKVKAQDPKFFENIQKGQLVFVYPKKVVVFDPAANRIIKVGELEN